MKLSEKWLREWIDPDIDCEQLANQLTMAGIEVESVAQVTFDLSRVVVAEISTITVHPESDHLHICEISTGKGDMLQVVCGADNVRKGMRVALALPGAKLGDRTINESNIRGVTSSGMLCSVEELGLGDGAEGILELPADLSPGTSLDRFLHGNDNILEISLTPNRGDCLSILGIAREVAVLNRDAIRQSVTETVDTTKDETREVILDAPQACPHYAGRKIHNIHTGSITPLWMVEKLQRCGVRSISPVVDITNFVMLALGQPMHAFDDDRLNGRIHVRYARAGESVQLLDQQSCVCSDDVLLIADDKRAIALAGIMGGLETAVTNETRTLFLESAYFSPHAISGIARKYGLQTESSHRFERGVDYTLQVQAIELATTLILEICGGEPGPLIEATDTEFLPERNPIHLHRPEIHRLLGIQLPDTAVSTILERLNMETEQVKDGWKVVPPPYRFDIGIEADLIEEIARIYGYEHIPDQHLHADLVLYNNNTDHTALAKLRTILVNRGYHEAITYSFVDKRMQQVLEPAQPGLELRNPIAADLSVMRSSLWPGLVIALQHNMKRQQPRVRLFEQGLVFTSTNDTILQTPVIGGVICGNNYEKQWGIEERQSDFFDIKNDIEALLEGCGIQVEAVEYRNASHPGLHPGQSADLYYRNQAVGSLGALHPRVQKALKLAHPVYVFELQVSNISEQIAPRFQKLSKFPMVKRDLAIVVDCTVSHEQVAQCIRKAGSEHLINLELFDLYQGEGIDLGKKSLALGLTFQGSSSTLTDSEVESIMGDILSSLGDVLGGSLRE